LLDPQNWNKYSYGLNNPISYKDSSGYFTGKDHNAMEMAALRGLGYSNQAAARAARADVAMDDPHNMASGVPFLHHFVETSQNPQHGEQSDHSSVEIAKQEASQYILGEQISAVGKALSGEIGQALDALGNASHTAQDIIRHQYETAGQHPIGEAPATDAETKAAVAATQEVINTFETMLTNAARSQGMSYAQIDELIYVVRLGSNSTPTRSE
jgi:hypothetical protein